MGQVIENDKKGTEASSSAQENNASQVSATTSVTLKQARWERTKKALDWLCETFPQCFNMKHPKPLKISIEKDIFPHGFCRISSQQMRQNRLRSDKSNISIT